jgi:hypothetical protein
MDLLSASNKILIDYGRRTVSFAVPDADAKPLPHPRCFMITVSIQGVPLRLVVDTGFEGIAVHALHADRIELDFAAGHLRWQ